MICMDLLERHSPIHRFVHQKSRHALEVKFRERQRARRLCMRNISSNRQLYAEFRARPHEP